MIGVKDHKQESLAGQAGEIEPVYDKYALGLFLFDRANKVLHFPQFPASGSADAPTLFGYRLTHRQASRQVEIELLAHPGSGVSYRFPCPFGSGIDWAELDGNRIQPAGTTVAIPAGTNKALVKYH